MGENVVNYLSALFKYSLLILTIFQPSLLGKIYADENDKPSAVESLRQTIFKADLSRSSCKVVNKGSRGDLIADDGKITKFIKDLDRVLKTKDAIQFQFLFHPRADTNSRIGEKIFSILRHTYARPWNFSIYRVYGLNTVNGDKKSLFCEKDKLSITSLYGYPLQFAVVFQIMGQNELGRILAMIVPSKGKWYIGGFHVQQWTFKGSDHESWIRGGLNALNRKENLVAHVKFDVAQKLLFGGDFLTYQIKDEIIKARDNAITKELFLKKVQKELASDNIVYLGTVLAEDNAGLVIRERVYKDYTTQELQEKCMSSGKKLIQAKILTPSLGGVKCDYIYSNESIEREGVLGGLYYSQKKLLSPAEKKK